MDPKREPMGIIVRHKTNDENFIQWSIEANSKNHQVIKLLADFSSHKLVP